MARFSDLPPELRLEIYRLLLVNPIREGLRIVFFLDPSDSNQIRRSQSRCVRATMPHEEGLYHLDFTDLMSFAMTNKTLYAEASQIICNNTGLTVSLSVLPRAARPVPALTLFGRYLERLSPSTRDMLPSLVIHDKSVAMSPRDAKSLVELVNTHLPNLRAFRYYVNASAGLLEDLELRFRSAHFRATKAVQPFVGLPAGVRTTLALPASRKIAVWDTQLHSELSEISKHFAEEALERSGRVHESRRATREHHELALNRDLYLHVTLALRSSPDMDMQSEEDILEFEEILAVMLTFDITFNAHHEMLRAARTSS
jgi:hypothetical protein